MSDVRIHGLSKSFRGTPVLDGIDLAIGAGERVALVGANGAGKTTLIRCLLGEYRHGGRVAVGGMAPREQRREVLLQVGFVPQLPPPLKMPVPVLLDFAASVCGSAAERMAAVSQELGLDPAALGRRPFEKLSGGQKQKLLIAVALGRDADVLVLDEPAANLDPDARAVFFELLAERAERTTMLISSHRLDEVASLVHRVVELDRGRVALDDRVAQAGGLATRLVCRLELARPEEAAARALRAWGLDEDAGGRVFRGRIAGPDRLRFLGAVARYAGLVVALELRDEEAER